MRRIIFLLIMLGGCASGVEDPTGACAPAMGDYESRAQVHGEYSATRTSTTASAERRCGRERNILFYEEVFKRELSRAESRVLWEMRAVQGNEGSRREDALAIERSASPSGVRGEITLKANKEKDERPWWVIETLTDLVGDIEITWRGDSTRKRVRSPRPRGPTSWRWP